MKKYFAILVLTGVLYLPMSKSSISFAANGYQMKSERCTDGSTQQRCRPFNNSTCSVSDQTSCGGGGGGAIQ
jgi:hypothetical protein